MVKTDRRLSIAAWAVAVATLVSGPIGFAATFGRAQPPWRDAATYAAHAHPLQQAPFWAGFLLIAASVLFVARMAAIGFERYRTRSLVALVAVAVYAAIIAINYALQVAFVPELARTADPALGYVTMTNPRAATWALEMFGYGVLGVATAIVAPIIEGSTARRRLIRGLLIANGVVSVAGAIATAASLSWVQTPAGIASFLGWNVLLIAAMVLVGLDYGSVRPVRAAYAA